MQQTSRHLPRRFWLYSFYIVLWLVLSFAVGGPILNGLHGILAQMSLWMRLMFYLMPPMLVGLLILGVLQIISMYRYWFGPR